MPNLFVTRAMSRKEFIDGGDGGEDRRCTGDGAEVGADTRTLSYD